MRRLPVYLLIDTSESTLGEAHDSIMQGVSKMLGTLRKNPYALETVWLSIITFDATARVVAPLTDICEFVAPEMPIHPGTALGAAIETLRTRLSLEVMRSTPEKKGDWRPLVFFLTDGAPTDEWRGPLARFKATTPRPAHVCAIGCGDDVDFAVLRELADEVFQLNAESEQELPELFNRLFVWLSASVNSASRGLEEDAAPPQNALPKGVARVENGDATPPRNPARPKFVFFHRICSTTRRHYLVRLTYNGKFYSSPRTFKVEKDFFSEGDPGAPEIPSELIVDDSRCPYCDAYYVFHCECGAMSCLQNRESVFTCPSCGQKCSMFGSHTGGIRGSLG